VTDNAPPFISINSLPVSIRATPGAWSLILVRYESVWMESLPNILSGKRWIYGGRSSCHHPIRGITYSIYPICSVYNSGPGVGSGQRSISLQYYDIVSRGTNETFTWKHQDNGRQRRALTSYLNSTSSRQHHQHHAEKYQSRWRSSNDGAFTDVS
jgi:hypothetical protein